LVRHFIELKARLTWNGFKTDTQRKVGLPVATILLLSAGFWLAHKYTAVYGSIATVDQAAGAEYLGWCALFAFLVWTTLPVIIFPLDENLDPQQMATLPVSPNQMVAGLTAASLIAPSMVVLAIVGFANARILADGWWMIPPASVVLILLFIVGSQLLSAAVSAVLRNRRGRDLATFLIFGLAGSAFFIYRSVDELVAEQGFVRAVLSYPILDKAWFLPPVAAQRSIIEAASGQPSNAVLFLLVAMVGVAVMALTWRGLTQWMITTPSEGSRPAARSRRNGMASGPWGTIMTLARKELRFYVRDPRQRLVWTGTVIFVGLGVAGAVMGTTGFFDVRDQEWGPLVAPVLVLFVGLPIALNLFGWERNAASYLFVLPVKPRSLLLGKNLAVTTALLLETGILTLILAAFTGQWKWVWLVPPLAISAIGCQMAVGNFVSVITPLRLPREGTDVFAQSTEQGCLAIASQTISFFAIGLLLIPPVSAIVLTVGFGGALHPLLAVVITVGWGALFYAMSLWISGILLRRRLPEVLDWVQVV
jgi:hypothetical protein